MEATDFIIDEPSGQKHLENIDQSLMRFHGKEKHDLDSYPIAMLSHENAQTGQKFTIPISAKGFLRVGRDPKCDFSIDSIIVSKQQFRIYAIIYDAEKLDEYPPSIYCEDLESMNGTYVNDVLIGKLGNERIGHLLADGDLIEIRPDWKFRFNQPRSRMTSHMSLPDVELQYFRDRFTISNHVLGSGIAGEVFLANRVGTSKQVACKVVKLSSSGLPGSQSQTESNQQYEADLRRKTYLREVCILSRLNHPNIISIEKAFLSNDRLYLFTELAAAGDLYTYFDSCDNRLGDGQARLITRQIALALEYLHTKGIAHRDIKMENILITNTDVGSRVILTDFGLANHTEKSTGRLFSCVGTEGYVAPEIVGSDSTLNRGYTIAADMWSFGILTWSLLTGESEIPRGRLSQLEEIEATKHFISSDEKEAAEKWSYLHTRARSFLRGLLAIDAGQRMTAVQALNHPWYKEPSASLAIEQAYARAIQFWRPRGDGDILEYLPGYVAPAGGGVGSVRRKRLPDASQSPYFNLDRHLQSRSPQMAKRRQILDDLKESGESFMDAELQQDIPRHNTRIRDQISVNSVAGSDLFGSQTALANKQIANSANFSDRTSEDVSKTGINQRAIGNSRSLTSSTKTNSACSSTLNDARVRKETDPANQGIHDAASQFLTGFCSAKAFMDKVNVVRKEKIMKT
ncbi:ddae8d5f-1741-4f7b-b46d-a3c257f53528 [Sclerotinia trifoliorum]|uniref:Ddae8d5f-1741-4f7b-b46d-a3c257f53528 n=1 Tax=Sclerotinia trifoliorum TaxID=28548 RepID=A0A8H2VLR5_9HELO|nr:ddae8d5f-1741-4f7b-b46d-a3c257f53528 [Sclerotinia trifoliorum]